MFNARIPRAAGDDEPPDAGRRGFGRRRLAAGLALASALAVGLAMMVAQQPAQALTSIDGQWTVVHGGTGLITMNTDGTYTSTCEVYPDYPDAWCPAPSGTFQFSTLSTASVTFTGTDGSTHSYRVSGPVSSPDTITSVFGSRTYSPLVMKPGSDFVCTVWSGTGTSFTQWGISPEVWYDADSELLYATGSNDLVGPKNIDTQVNLAETAPNYFQNGPCAGPDPNLTMASFIHIDSVRDTSVSSTTATWAPQATITIKDLAGDPAPDTTVSGTFSDDSGATLQQNTCVTAADGSCTLGGFTLDDSETSTQLYVYSVTKSGASFNQPVSSDPTAPSIKILTLNEPSGPAPTPTPTPVTYHVGDLDNVTIPSSSRNWKPLVTATVLDENGVAVAGATVSGTFTDNKGTVTCTTTADGTCTLGNVTLRQSVTSTVFTVTDVVESSSVYASGSNSDPDGDSNGTVISIPRP
ncbi:hypothetical protein GCM10022240_14540 [Microbacterium kribbense]|uniref:Big-1 domain-containing protein n=1 Tax=Microbacterium kribbense TaxID=433645 RepID=A0ABP7GDZ4_9MICO